MEKGFKVFRTYLNLELCEKIVCEGSKVVLTWENIMNYHKNLHVEVDDMLNFLDSVYSKIQSKEILKDIQKIEATKGIIELVENNEIMKFKPNKFYTNKNDIVVIFYYNIFSLFNI